MTAVEIEDVMEDGIVDVEMEATGEMEEEGNVVIEVAEGVVTHRVD